jgi:putative membrane protein
MTDPANDRRVQSIGRPDKALMVYYFLTSLIILPAFPILIVVMYFRYHTMRYKFSDDGISMSWGILFRREIIVNYARIQDIHLRSNIVERWLGLARILIQTASGSQSAELTIEGIKEFDMLRDFLYSRMRGVKDHHVPTNIPATSAAAPGTSADELTAALREVTTELRAVREAIEKRGIRPEESRHV